MRECVLAGTVFPAIGIVSEPRIQRANSRFADADCGRCATPLFLLASCMVLFGILAQSAAMVVKDKIVVLYILLGIVLLPLVLVIAVLIYASTMARAKGKTNKYSHVAPVEETA